MSGVERVGGTDSASFSSESIYQVTAKEAFKMLGSLRESVHKAAVQMQNVEPRIPIGQALTQSFIAGLFVTAFCPPVGIGIVALGVATAVLHTTFTLGVNAAGGAVAHLTQGPPQDK